MCDFELPRMHHFCVKLQGKFELELESGILNMLTISISGNR